MVPLKTARPKGELAVMPVEETSSTEDNAAGKATAKPGAKKVGCIIPAKTAAATTLMLATAASVLQPSASIMHLAPDACLHVGVEDYCRMDALCARVLSSADDEASRFREMLMP